MYHDDHWSLRDIRLSRSILRYDLEKVLGYLRADNKNWNAKLNQFTMKRNTRDSILNFQIDDPEPGLDFSQRLAHENGWSKSYTSRVVNEYLRFLVLCSEAGHKVTPSALMQ